MEFLKKITLKKLLPAFIILFGIAVFTVLKATRPTSESLPSKERIWQVQTVAAKLQQLSPVLTLYGQVETPALVKASAPKKSRVVSVSVREGDPVSKGQILLSLDERDFKPRVIQAEAKAAELKAVIKSEQLRHRADQAAINHEQAILELEQSSVRRANQLKNKKLGSTAALEEAQEALQRQQLAYNNRKLALDDHQARLQQLHARLAHAEADVELARLDLERSQVIAAFNGFVESLAVAAGDQVNENQLLLTIYPSDELEIRAKIPAPFQNEIQQALHAAVTLTASADYAGTALSLSLDRFAGKAETRGIDALFRLQSNSALLRLGASLTVTLQRPRQNNVIVLPHSAIYDNNRIYRVIKQRMEAIPVTIIGDITKAEKNQLLIQSPEIRENDRIVITQLPAAISGLKVE